MLEYLSNRLDFNRLVAYTNIVILCHCFRITHKDIRKCVESGACSLKDIREACRACSGCGGCKQAVLQELFIALRLKTQKE